MFFIHAIYGEHLVGVLIYGVIEHVIPESGLGIGHERVPYRDWRVDTHKVAFSAP